LLNSWRFSSYRAPIHWLVYGHITSNNENCLPPWPNAMSGQHCENYDVKRETVHCYPRNVDRCCMWSERAVEDVVAGNSARFCFCFVLLYNKSLNDWSLGEQWILFPSNLDSRETKFTAPLGTSLSVLIVSLIDFFVILIFLYNFASSYNYLVLE